MPTDIVPIRRALLSVSDKTGLVDLGQALARAGRRAGLDRRHRQGAARRRADGARRLRPDRLSRDDGRPGQDAPPEGPWRPARGARRSRACRGDGRAWDRRDRPGRGQSLSVRADRREGRRARRDHREYRHRRPVDGALGGQEPRLSSRSSPIRPIMRWSRERRARRSTTRKRLAAKAFAATAAYDAMIASWFAFADQGERFPTTLPLPMLEAGRAALRREPAPAGGALPARRPAGARHRARPSRSRARS